MTQEIKHKDWCIGGNKGPCNCGAVMTTQDINRAFHEAAGKCWHAPALNFRGYCHKCGKTITKDKITGNIIRPDYRDDPRLVIEVMMERKDWIKFLQYITNHCLSGYAAINNFTRDLIMDRTGKLRDLALEWINKQKGKSDEK